VVRRGHRHAAPADAADRTAWPGQHNAVSLTNSALTFALRIAENWVQTCGTAQWPEYDVHAGSAWNYGLVPNAAVTVSTGGGDLSNPFSPTTAPIQLTTTGQRIDAWQADSRRVVMPLQDGPVASLAPAKPVTLIPMGAARLRITTFPQTGGTRQWVSPGAPFRLQNRNSGKVLGVDGMSTANSANMSTANSARVQQFEDNGTTDHLWQLIDSGNGYLRLKNFNSGKVVGVSGMSTADSAQVVQFDDNGTADHDWRPIPDGQIKVQNVNSGKLLAVENMPTANSARVQQFADTGTDDHLWVFLPDAPHRQERLRLRPRT
jgi:Ricin-type beta-trefoil lectin domain-like